MTLLLALIVLFWVNLVYPAVVTTAVLKVKCDPVYQGFISQATIFGDRCLTGKANQLVNFSIYDCNTEYKFCADGSLRRVDKDTTVGGRRVNREECITNEDKEIKHMDCDTTETDAKKLKWNLVDTKFSHNNGRIVEKLFLIKTTDDECLERSLFHSSLEKKTCDPTNKEQQFFFRSRGKVLKQGKIYNRSFKKCIADVGSVLDDCATTAKSIKYFENGEILLSSDNDYDKCLIADRDNVNVDWDTCYRRGKYWDATNCNEDDSCLFLNIEANKCLKFSGNKHILANCVIENDTLFNFVYGNWTTSRIGWTMLGCNQDGKISIHIQNEISYGTGSSKEIGASASLALSGEAPFVNVEPSVSASINLAKTWEENYGSTVKSIMTCESYEDSETDKFTHGCMWQLQVTTFNRKKARTLKWRPPIVKCTRSAYQPKCAPFMKCKTRLCTQCIPEDQLTTTTRILKKNKT